MTRIIRKEIKQRDIAELLGMSDARFSRILSGYAHIQSWEDAQSLADITNTEPAIWLKDGGTAKDRRAAFRNLGDILVVQKKRRKRR